MKHNLINRGLVALTMATMVFGLAGVSVAQTHKPGMKQQTKRTNKSKVKKAAGEVKYKAECGMVYTAAEAKKNNYICPMDHKPLKKIVVASKPK